MFLRTYNIKHGIILKQGEGKKEKRKKQMLKSHSSFNNNISSTIKNKYQQDKPINISLLGQTQMAGSFLAIYVDPNN